MDYDLFNYHSTGSGSVDHLVISATNVKYIMMYGITRLIGYGYSIWEFQVYGQPKYLWSTNNGTESTISFSIYSGSVTLNPTTTTTYSVLIPDPCIGYATLTSTVTINCSAPVTLIDFQFLPEGQGTNIEWTTASEQNSSYFEVLKSNDGIHFYSIGKVSALGNSITTHTYSFQDNTPNKGIAYYKLATIDIDGSKDESEIKSIQSKTTKAFVLSPVFEEETSLIVGGKVAYIQYSIIDMIGREILTNKYIQNPSDIHHLAPAYYLLKLNTDTYYETIKFVR